MAGLGLREAATEAGVSKSTIFRAIKSGRLSASRDDDGNFAIDPAELFRVYPQGGPEVAPQRPEAQQMKQTETTDLRIRNATLQAELEAARSMLEEARADRDRWAAQAERLALAPPPAVAPVGFWKKLFR